MKKYQRLKNNTENQSELVTAVVHELKTPISTIKEAISLLSDLNYGKLNAKSKKILLIAQEETNRLIRMVNNLLKVSIIEAGKIQLHFEPTKIEKIINQVLDSQSFTIQKKDMHIKTSYLHNSPDVFIDRDRLFDTIANLIDNALKFTPECGTITIQTKKIKPGDSDYQKQHLNSKLRYLKTTITDTGPGISKQDLYRVFKKFERITAPIPVRGIGLGLTIAKNIIELHQGKIWAASEKGKGAVFHFVLPIKYYA
jgi:signal transduction histidine kinase